MRSTSYTATSITEVPAFMYHHDCTSEQLNGRHTEDSELVALKSGETYAWAAVRRLKNVAGRLATRGRQRCTTKMEDESSFRATSQGRRCSVEAIRDHTGVEMRRRWGEEELRWITVHRRRGCFFLNLMMSGTFWDRSCFWLASPHKAAKRREHAQSERWSWMWRWLTDGHESEAESLQTSPLIKITVRGTHLYGSVLTTAVRRSCCAMELCK